MFEVKIVLLSIFANFCTTFLLATLLLASRKRYKNFIMFNIVIAFWSLFYGLQIIAQSEYHAILYTKIYMFILTMIPYLFLGTSAEISGFKIKKTYSRINGIVVIVMALSMTTPYMITGVKPFLGFEFVPKISWFFYSFHAYYVVTVSYSLFLVHKSIKNNYKNKLIFYGFVTGFIGGTTNFFQYSEIPIYPYFNFLIAIYCLIATYALMKHRMLDGMSAMREGIVKVISFLILLLIYIVLLTVYNLLVPDEDLFPIWLFNGLYLLVAIEMHQILNKFLHSASDKLLGFGVKYKKNSLQEEINTKILDIVNIKTLSDNLKHLIERGMGVKIQSFYIAQEVSSGNDFSGDQQFVKYFGKDLPKDGLEGIKNAMCNEGLILSVKRNEANSNLHAIMTTIDCHGLVPFIFNKKVMGFLCLESRPGKSDYFYYEDMQLFDDLAEKSGMALERVRLHMDIVNQKEKTLKSLAGSIAHEVRNPLAALSMIFGQIKEYANDLSQQNLSQEGFSQNKGKLLDLTRIALKSVRRTNQIIDMTLGDLRGDKIDKDKFVILNSNESIKNALNEYGYNGDEEKQRVIFKENESSNFTFKGDETMFVYIIFNLVKNALYYSKECPDLTICVKSKVNEEGNNIIEVMDTGPGIPTDKLESIFESFTTSGKKGGTGLGLPFCRRVMDSFKGSIKCESEPGKYTKFILSFPKLDDSEIINSKTKSILLFDDQNVSLKASQRLLNEMAWDLEIDIVIDGQDTLKHIERKSKSGKSYDLIILDINMPYINGLEVAKTIREADQNVPIIFYTSETSNEVKKSSMDLSVNDYIIKSDPDSDLINTFNKWILTQNKETQEPTDDDIKKILEGQEILIADDEALNLKMLSNLLRKNGLKVKEFDNAEDLMKEYKSQFNQAQNSPEKINKYTIITDINMPGMSGNELAKEIRTYELINNLTNHCVIIGYSGDSDAEKLAQFKKDGIDDCFVKGDDGKNLLKMLAFWVGGG